MPCSHTATDVFFTINQTHLDQHLFSRTNHWRGEEEEEEEEEEEGEEEEEERTYHGGEGRRMRRRREDSGKMELRDEKVEDSSAKSNRQRR